ncbi:MAG: right-handed parallel beta-helix repeat-containing protein [Terracidiphilus sp.]|jgi:hypothetical protein
MIRSRWCPALYLSGRAATLLLSSFLTLSIVSFAQTKSSPPAHAFYIDCASTVAGDGSIAHPWNSLATAQAHTFAAGDRVALARGTVCNGSFAPQGTGAENNPIRLTAYGQGPLPRIVATANDRQALLLFNQEYWQIDSLDISGGNKYGIFVSGDRGTLHHIALKNLFVHDVQGGELKNKDNGLVVIGPSSRDVIFSDILVDGVIAAHTNQWAGILIGGGNYAYAPDAPLNSHVTVRNSEVHDVYGDGIVLFRDSNSLIETSTAWETGMQPTETTGTPNAIWTWTCTDCTVRDNEAFLTDSPGVDGGAYDIDWDDTRNTVERNYGHDTQGYCFAVFAAGYVTRESIVRDNLCIDNGLSPRLAALQGAVYLHSWNDGVLRGLRIEHNTFDWNPPVSSAAAIVDDAETGGVPVTFSGNRIESAAPNFYRISTPFAPCANTYVYSGTGEPTFTLGGKKDVTLTVLQSAGIEAATTLQHATSPSKTVTTMRLDATVDFILDADGLLAPGARAQLMVLRSLAAQYGPAALAVSVHLHSVQGDTGAEANALLDLDDGTIQFDHSANQPGLLRLFSTDGRILVEWKGFQNAATLGGAVRARLGAPHFSNMRPVSLTQGKQ